MTRPTFARLVIGRILSPCAGFIGEKILPITRRANVGLVINDHLEIAREIGAEFCHLGQEDFFDAGFTHCSEIQKPEARSQNWFVHACICASNTSNRSWCRLHRHRAGVCDGHEAGRETVTLDYVRWVAANVTVPWFAIGGIRLENLGDVLAGGRNCRLRGLGHP